MKKIDEISKLESVVDKLPQEEKEIWNRNFEVSSSVGKCTVRENIKEWVKERFGSVEAVENQRVIRVDNLLTGEGALFNELRAKRPMRRSHVNIIEKIEEERVKCDFCCSYEKSPTPMDGLTGTLSSATSNNYCFSISNISKYDALHGQVIFPADKPEILKYHEPYYFTEEMMRAWLDVAQKWYRTVHDKYYDALFPVFSLNILWKAGASIIHPHPHILLATKKHYPKISFLNRVRNDYQEKYNADYFDDLFKIHESLGLATSDKSDSIRVMCNVVPRKEKETIIYAKDINLDFIRVLTQTINCFIEKLYVQSFNLVIVMPPLEKIDGWQNFPIIAHVLDRGSLDTPTVDFGFMETYMSSVIASDPFKVFPIIKKNISL